MASLSLLRSYWANNTTLNNALPATSVFLDLAAPGTALPYACISLISAVPTLTTAAAHIEELRFQVSIWHTSLNTLEALADTIDSQFSQISITIPTLIVTRSNRISRAFVDDAVYTYNTVLTYVWWYNSQTT